MKPIRFHFSHQTDSPEEERRERFFRALPGVMSWTILGGLILGSFTHPILAAALIIMVDIYWLLRLFYMTLFMVVAYGVLAVEKESDWNERAALLREGESALEVLSKRIRAAWQKRNFRRWLSLRNQTRELKEVILSKTALPTEESIYHVVIIAAAKESEEVLRPGIEAIAASRFPLKNMIVILAVEARSGARQQELAEMLQKKYRSHFYDFLVAIHPDGTPGEAKVKGANVTYAAKRAAAYLKEKGIDYGNVIASCFDADTVVSPGYFACLTYHFIRTPDRTRASYQPLPVYHNNIWEAPGFARVLETGSSFFQLVEATNPEKLITFSSHSMSFKALVEIGYWPVDMISDDSAIFWKALIHYDGNYRVLPMYVTVSMDVVMSGSFWKTMVNVYKQKRRWAWGVENFPVVVRGFRKTKSISPWQKFRYYTKLIEMHVSWATVGFILTFIGWLPAIFSAREFSNTVFYYNSPRITSLIFNLAGASLFVTIVISLLLLPKHKTNDSWRNRILFAAEWLLVPLVFTLLSTAPALDAQTRMAFSRKMEEFWVTEKKRKTPAT